MAVRRYYIDQALNSFVSLSRVLHELSEEEVLASLRLEAASRRRQSILDRLISRAARLNELRYVLQLKESLKCPAPPARSCPSPKRRLRKPT